MEIQDILRALAPLRFICAFWERFWSHAFELMAMNEELTNFAFIASHDLREPVRKVTLFSHELSMLAKESPFLNERKNMPIRFTRQWFE